MDDDSSNSDSDSENTPPPLITVTEIKANESKDLGFSKCVGDMMVLFEKYIFFFIERRDRAR